MDFTPENIERAVVSFYSDSRGNAQINDWLTQAQRSVAAWEFTWILLSNSKVTEVQFFAGNTLYMKVSRYWREVPLAEYESLKLRLLNSIVQHSNCRVVLHRLTKTLAAYVLHTITNDWPSALEDIISMFNPENVTGIEPSKALDLLFNVLMIIPCELENCHEFMKLTQLEQKAIRTKLKSQSNLVLDLTRHVIQSPHVTNDIKDTVLKNLNTWLQLSIPLSSTKDLLVSLIPYSNYGIMCESTLECLKTAVNDSTSYCFPKIILEFITELLGLIPALQEALQCEDENTAALLYNLFTSVAESHSKLLLENALDSPETAPLTSIVALLVDCASTPGQYPSHESISSIPFPVWYTLQDDMCTFKTEYQNKLMKLLKPFYLKLIDNFLQKSILPADGLLGEDEQELFRCYRQDISDAYMYAYTILRDDILFRFKYHWEIGVQKIQQDEKDWRYMESVLHAFSSIAETVSESESPYVAMFIERIPTIPFNNNFQLVAVALTTLGSYADWLNLNQGYLQYAIPIMVTALVHSTLVGAASQALRDLTLECPRTIAPFGQTILDSCQKALKQIKNIDCPETERILTILSRVLSVSHDDEYIMVYLNDLLSPFFHRLNTLKDSPDTFTSVEKCHEVTAILKLFFTIARHLNVHGDIEPYDEIDNNATQGKVNCRTQPLLHIIQPLMPIVAEIAAKAPQNYEIVEHICKLLKNSMITLQHECEPFLPAMLDIIPRLYKCSSNPAALDIVKQILVLFGNSTHRDNMRILLGMIISSTLENSSVDIWNHTDTLSSAFNLIGVVVRKVPFLAIPENVSLMCTLSIEAMKLPEESTLKSIAYFWVGLINRSKDTNCEAFSPLVVSPMEKVLRNIMLCMCNAPRHNLTPICEILAAFCKWYPGELGAAFKPLIAEENFPTSSFTKTDKEEFCSKILRCRSSKKRVLEVVSDYAMISKGIGLSLYSAETRRSIM